MKVSKTKGRAPASPGLLHERNLYRDLVASLPAGVYRLRVTAAREWVDREWVARLATNYSIEMASNAFCRILGVTQAQRRANVQIVADRIHPDDRADFIACNVAAMKSLTKFRWVGRILKGREVRWVEFSSVPRPLENGDVLWTGILQDITERRQMEAKLLEEQKRIDIILATVGDPIFVKDNDHRFVLVNRAFYDMLGLEKKDVIGRTLGESLSAAEMRHFLAVDRRVLDSGSTELCEEVLTNKNGVKMTIVTKKTRFLDDSGNRFLVGAIHDITAHKQVAEALRQTNEQLESRVRERTSSLQFLAAELTRAEHKERRRIAHLLHENLQQCLAAIMFKVHELKASSKGGPALQTADHILLQLEEAIELTRTLATRLVPPVLHQFGLRPALETLAQEMATQFMLAVKITGLRTFRLPSDDTLLFAFDAVRELLLNVAKHSGVKSAEVRIRPAGRKRIAVEVRDKGKGMARNRRKTDRFGLFSIRERAEAMGIGFDITSRPGKGTCVALFMPIL